MTPDAGRPARGGLLVLAAATLFGTIGTARVLGPDAPAASVGAARLVVAAVLLVAFAWPHLRGGGAAGEVRRPATLVAGVAQAAFQVTFLAAVVLTGVAVGTLVAIGSAPLFAGLISRRVTARWAVATALAVVGLLLLVLGGGGARLTVGGTLLALGAGLSYATYTVATGRAVAGGAVPAVTTAVAFTVAAVVLLPALAVTDLHWLATPSGLLMAVYLGLVPTALAYRLFAAGLRSVAASVASTIALAEPVVAALLGVLVLGERLSGLGWLGAALVLLALALAARRPAAPRPSPEPATLGR
ncbi:MAG: EamA family transporter [Angustibacter sp.]